MRFMGWRESFILFLWSFSLFACSEGYNHEIKDIHISSAGGNNLKVQIDVHTTNKEDVFIEYWPKGKENKLSYSFPSKNNIHHKLILTNLVAGMEYEFRIVVDTKGTLFESKNYSFVTPAYPMWMKDIFRVICPDSSIVPKLFLNGYTMLYRREDPGILFFLNSNGDIVWYHQVNGTGFKVARFTKNNTIICILGTTEYQTSYGNEILELSLSGDTIFHLKKGEKDLKQTVHHDILLNDSDQVVTISSEERVFDLTSLGGSKMDTIKSDGILVLDKQGHQVWKWSIFDALDPTKDKNILKEKNDWMHANSLALDKDGNYLLSFYNNGQVWKINSTNGKLIWKLGNGGNTKIPAIGEFDNCHAVHINPLGDLMLFDNGTSKEKSRVMAFKIDEKNKTAQLALNMELPPDMYTERMGSAYMVNDSSILICCSKKNTVALTNLKGRFVWALRTGFMPYRTEFVPTERVKSYFTN